MTNTAAEIQGTWQGFVEIDGNLTRFVLRVETDGVNLAVFLDDVENGSLNNPLLKPVFDGRLLSGQAFGGAEFAVALQEDGTLAGQLHLPGTAAKIDLRREHPGFRKYEQPLLDENNQAVLSLACKVPPDLGDGWPTGSLPEEGIDPSGISRLLQDVLEGRHPQLHSLLIARNGRLLLEEYFYGHEREKLHTIQSVTKSINSILIGIAVDRGEISRLDQMVYEYFPRRTDRRWVAERHPITLRHALSMCAALDWNESLPYSDPRNDNTAMNRSSDWIGYILDRPMAGIPGGKYMYTSGLSILLGEILHAATGLYTDEYAQKHLFPYLGIERFSWYKAADGTRHTGGGLALRARDLAKLGEMMRQGGVWAGCRVLSEAWARASTRQQTPPGDYAYGYQWHIRRSQIGSTGWEGFCGLGYGGQFVYAEPEQGLTVEINAGMYGGDPRLFEILETYILPAVERQK